MAICDLDMPERTFIPLEKMEDLDSYIQTRNKMYDEAMKRCTSIDDMKDLISKRFFGMPYQSDMDSYYRASTLSLSGMIRYYSVDNLLGDSRTQQSDLFSQDEVEKFLNSKKLIPNIVSYRNYYLKQLLTMPSDEAVEKTLK